MYTSTSEVILSAIFQKSQSVLHKDLFNCPWLCIIFFTLKLASNPQPSLFTTSTVYDFEGGQRGKSKKQGNEPIRTDIAIAFSHEDVMLYVLRNKRL